MNQKKTILIVDDDENALGATAFRFRVLGYRVLEASNQRDALNLAKEESDLSLALIDVKLNRDSEGGLKLVSAFRSKHPNVRLIVYTGAAEVEIRRKALNAGAMFFIDKTNEEGLIYAAKAVAEMWELEREFASFRLGTEWIQNVLDSIGFEILIRDQDRNVLSANRRKLVNWSKRYTLSDKEVMSELSSLVGTDGCLDFKGKNCEFPSQADKNLGEFREYPLDNGGTLQVVANPIKDETGNTLGFVETGRNISPLKLLLDLTQELTRKVYWGDGKKPNWNQVCQMICDAFQKFTKGRIRFYLVQNGDVRGIASSGMREKYNTLFLNKILRINDPGTKDSFDKRTISVVKKDKWPKGNDPHLGVINATEKIYIPFYHPKTNKPFCTITIDNEIFPSQHTSNEELDLLNIFRNSVENILWTALRREEERLQQKWDAAILKVDEILMEEIEDHDEESIYHKVCRVLSQALGSHSGTFYRFLPDGRIQDLFQLGGVPERTENPYTPLPESRKLEAKNTNDIVVIEDVHNNQGCIDYLKSANEETRKHYKETSGILIIPFETHNTVEAVGVFHFKRHLANFSIEDRKRSDEMRRRVSIALTRVQTYQQAREVAIRRSEEAQLGRLTAGFSHSLKTAIQESLTRITDAKHEEAPPVVIENLEIASDNLEELVTRIDEIKQFVFPKERDPLQSNIADMFRQLGVIAQPTADDKSIDIDIQDVDPALHAISNGGVVRMVLIDLVQNALKFTGQGGTLTLCTDIGKEEVTIIVGDTGPGLKPALLKVFNSKKGSRSPSRNIGLGLHLALSMIPEIGGKISAENRSGNETGAIFKITLPKTSK